MSLKGIRLCFFFFFFSSRRRHTRLQGDWSSDVCSSDLALQREAFGGPLADKQSVQNWIADSAAEMQAARLMTLHAAWVIDKYGASAARKEISLIKFFGAKVLHDVIDRAIQIHGSL